MTNRQSICLPSLLGQAQFYLAEARQEIAKILGGETQQNDTQAQARNLLKQANAALLKATEEVNKAQAAAKKERNAPWQEIANPPIKETQERAKMMRRVSDVLISAESEIGKAKSNIEQAGTPAGATEALQNAVEKIQKVKNAIDLALEEVWPGQQ